MELGVVSILENSEKYVVAHNCEENCVDCQTDNDHADNKC
jgi:hypothetical protein